MMSSAARSPRSACLSALAKGFRDSAAYVCLDEKGYVADAVQNLIEGVSLAHFEADLLQGDGNEMGGKFRAAHSSSALAVNTFGRFKTELSSFSLLNLSGFTSLRFEQKCPHGLAGRRAPNLDIVATGPDRVIAVESKCLEHLAPHVAQFSPAYEAGIRDERRDGAWFQEMRRLSREPRYYRWLDGAQLVKHAFGIAHTFKEQSATLLYLFWEPSNPENHPVFAEHRAEVAQFAASIRGSGPEFVAMSYPELWRSWESAVSPNWVRVHVGRLKARYDVVV